MKYYRAICFVSFFFLGGLFAAEKTPEYNSQIGSVKLYQNQAQVHRTASVTLQKGENKFILTGLPSGLYDWSVKGKLPKTLQAKILGLEIEKKALLEKRQKKIIELEKKLEDLKEEDQELLDELRNIHSQNKFLDSIISFTNQNVSKELMTRSPQVAVWDNTLSYVSAKRKKLSHLKRKTEKEREQIGKRIQKWEFDLSQLAGRRYFQQYQNWNKLVLQNRGQLQTQEFGSLNNEYTKKRKLLRSPGITIEQEKRLIVTVFASREGKTNFNFNYIVPQANWRMQYDVRASAEKSTVNLLIYGDVYQKTGEDWLNVEMLLSTGSPQNTLNPPVLSSWYLSTYQRHSVGTTAMRDKKESMAVMADEAELEEKKDFEQNIQTRVTKKGPSVELQLPLKQVVESSTKRQKKFIKEKLFNNSNVVKFFYEITPQVSQKSFIKTEITNKSDLPFLPGEAQLFLENEFMGKVKIPYTPVGKSQELILGNDARITGKKVLDKKFEDTSGLFGGNRRFRYDYRIELENNSDKSIELFVVDAVPVSRNDKIKATIEKLSTPFHKDVKFEKTSEYARGLRKWKLSLGRGQKQVITYQAVIEFDKNVGVSGLR